MLQILNLLKDKGTESISWEILDKAMVNIDGEHMNQELFKAEYDANPQIKSAIHSFDPEGVNFKDSKGIAGSDTSDADKTVDTMAKRASSKTLN